MKSLVQCPKFFVDKIQLCILEVALRQHYDMQSEFHAELNSSHNASLEQKKKGNSNKKCIFTVYLKFINNVSHTSTSEDIAGFTII